MGRDERMAARRARQERHAERQRHIIAVRRGEGVTAGIKAVIGPSSNKALAGPPQNKQDGDIETLAGIDFASDEAAEFAAEEGLNLADFKGTKPSGVHGFTKADVRSIVAAKAE